MRILIVSDEESASLWDHFTPGKIDGVDLILSAGDLKPDYLSFLVTMANRPLLYVHGNHDGIYSERPPEGCECIDGRLVNINGLRILGLGGSVRYNGGPHQYTEAEMTRRIFRLRPAIFKAGGVDIILTHSPVRGYGDMDDAAHRGFECFLPLIKRYSPMYLIHGHVHKRYTPGLSREQRYFNTSVINANGTYYLNIPDKE